MLTNLEQNLCRPIQVLLLLFRVPAAVFRKVNQICSHLYDDVQRPALNIPIASRHYCAASVPEWEAEPLLAAINIR